MGVQMTSVGVFVLIFIALALTSASEEGGPCERIESKTCFMQSTVIDLNDFLITSARDETVGGFRAENNKKLKLLPKNIGEKFPNLIDLSAHDCLIKEISKRDFKDLTKLRWLNLEYNQIEKIDDDTFEYISAVEQIWLSNNKIKKLNGRAFSALSQLTYVDLSLNVCVDESFYAAARIAEMPEIITSKCGFTEAPKPKACGVSKKAAIARGESLKRGDFPWKVALFRRLKQRRAAYFCAGSVISDRHVLTAARCLENLVARDIAAVFGAHNLVNHFEVGRFVQSPSRIFVHDDWNPRADQFDADIAMLLMPKKIDFSSFVQPICLWESQAAPTALVGVIAGWGQSQNVSRNDETIPTMLELPIHTNEDCFLKFPQLSQVSSNRTFCAGSADGRGPCRGDIGGGFYVSDGNVFYLRGIVSAAWDVDQFGECLLKMFTIYTNVLKFKPWIEPRCKAA